MDSYEATRMVFSRIQSLDPENASKIMGYLLLQDHGEKEMIRLAFGPEPLVHNLIYKAKTDLGLSLSSSPTTPISRPNSNPLSRSSSSIAVSNGSSFEITNNNPSSPSNNPWHLSVFSPDLNNPMSPSSNSSRSYASMVNGNNKTVSGSLSSSVSSFYNNGSDLIDEYGLQDQLSFLTDSKADEVFDPRPELALNSPTGYNDAHLHRRSYSVPGVCFGSEDANSGFGWKPCLYFARGFCKNGSSCRFLHGDSTDGAAIVGSPSKLSEFEQCQELLRSKAAAAQQQHQKLAAASQFMTGASFPYNKCMNFLLQQQQSDSPRSPAASALMMGDDLHKYGRCRLERNGFPAMGFGDAMNNPGSRQIYLTFPADSTFREEDVSNYFSIYGPVQDVRIPYQQKRMFGFVTFVYPETVKIILAKGNPHFVCDSRVLVKPYKEKGKVQEKKQQHLDRGDYSACPSPNALDSRDPFDIQLGARMFHNNKEMLLRRKLEEHDLQQAIELQGRRLMNLQLMDPKNHGLSISSPIPSPTLSRTPNGQAHNFPLAGIDQEIPEDNSSIPVATVTQTDVAEAQQEMSAACSLKNGNSIGNNGNGEDNKFNIEDTDLHDSLEHILPDNLFASPKKSASEHLTVFSTAPIIDVDQNNKNAAAPSPSNNNCCLLSQTNMAPLRSCFLQIPRFSSGSGNIGM
ncbi:putative Zinc finger family protein / RNA recognition motif-containing protein [Tripterygium wilfordii]|uniref:Putative Zinc finger family protein / RNA recognition motif-containing protein n=1 Tax=Tripterygium wilfordii TaxID=458696 RepID=A0A7J7BU70_TRIWF|nr:zinc finger CCCH domain-containing protein 22-like [Tripterygium wilfordii]KAF5725461.1 putative Zinc finger family protein / RNA recognition motif-containing protein [Tripterygium wilfordii]